MSNLPESSSFDAGIYELETTDLVLAGPAGVTNTPLKSLTNRTRWLYDQNTSNVALLATHSAHLVTLDGQIASLSSSISSINTNLTFINGVLPTLAPLASPSFSGSPRAPTPGATNDTRIATTAFVQGYVAGLAPLASPALTGTPTAPTAAVGTSTTQIATTAFANPARTTGNPAYFKTAGGDLVMRGTVHVGDIVGPVGASVSFPTSFGSAPVVTVTLFDANNGGASAVATAENAITTSGFNWAAREINSFVQNATIEWHAIGPAP